jgi:pyruvate dehydrogenase (quinone)
VIDAVTTDHEATRPDTRGVGKQEQVRSVMARKKNVAQVLVDVLASAGVKRVYGVAGDSLNGLTDAIFSHAAVSWIPVRHEETGAFAAGAEAHLTGRLCVCAGSSGPGHLHLINGLYDCHRSRVPVLAIAAHIPSRELGSGYFQETHPERLFTDCSHFCEVISSPAQVPRLVELAIQTAVARSGVAVIVLPGDVALLQAEESAPRVQVSYERPAICASEHDVAAAARLLNDATKVTILGGAGCREAHAELVAAADALAAPVVHAMRGKEFIEYDNPFDVGMTGLLGFASGYLAMKDCDALLMLGTDFPYQQFFPEDARTIQVDLRREQLGRRTRLDLGIVGDVKTTLQALVPRITRKTARGHLEASLAHYRAARRGLDDLATGSPGVKPIHPQFVARTLDALAADDAIFTCDVGTPTVWAARYLTMNGRRRLLGSFTHGSMANALPQGIGAQLAHPERQVVSMSGDGGLAMLLGDLLTLRQVDLPVKLVVFNNASLGFVQLEMRAAGFLDRGVDLVNPDFAKLAEAAGMLGVAVDSPEDVRPALERVLQHEGPGLVDVHVNTQELVMPPSLQMEQVGGFALYMAKAVLSGRGDELVDLARTNLFR